MVDRTIDRNDAIFPLTKHLVSVTYGDLPAQTIDLVKLDILDTLGVAMAASSASPVCKKMAEFAREMGGKEESTIISFGGKVPSYMAAFVNAALIHSLNYDDRNDESAGHMACVVFPAAFAIAERVGKVSGKQLITAYAIAMDLECRLARALISKKTTHDWRLYGWIMPHMFGYFGATAAAGRLLGLDQDRLLSAFGLVYSQVAGAKQIIVSPGSNKEIYPSFPAKAGVLSALMAQKGINGPKDILESNAGLYNVYFQGEYDPTPLTDRLGKSFDGPGFYPYPSCGYTHTTVELTLRMVKENNINPQDVEAITVFVGPKAQALLQPLEIRRNPHTTSEAQYSIPFAVAVAIAKRKLSIGHFTAEGLKDPDVLRLSNKVDWQSDPECDHRTGTAEHPAKLEIKLRDGRVLRSEQREFRYGSPERPMSQEEIIEKFRDCASYSVRPLPKRTLEKVIEMATKLEQVDDVSQIMRLVS